jgi:hypothetical protein
VAGEVHVAGANQLSIDVGANTAGGYFGNFLSPQGSLFGVSVPGVILQEFNVLNHATAFPSGQVGIGTASPGYRLDVQGGQVNSSGGYCINGSNCITAWPTGSGSTGSANTWTGTQTFSANTNFPFGIWNANGRVGIGTTQPQAMLHVHGDYNNTGSGGIILDAGDGGGTPTSPDYSLSINPFVLGPGQVGYQFKTVSASGGTTIPLTFSNTGNVSVGGSITFPDNSVQSTAWRGCLNGGPTTPCADFAESVDVAGDRSRYEPGDLMVIDTGGTRRFQRSTEPYSRLVAGIYSTNPTVLGKKTSDPKVLADEVPMAMVGIVPTKVSAENGAIHAGDLLVTSSTIGMAMKGTDTTRMMGAVVGKALGSLDTATGVIEVLVRPIRL